MSKIQTFQEFFATQSVQIPVLGFVFNIILAALLAYILRYVYIRFGKSLSNRESFANNFIMITTTTLLIISIVKSSLALSLGLVGALSIVRFRAAIKEPEELSYLFLCIAVGLGLGADQRIITTVAFILIIGIILLKNIRQGKEEIHNLHLVISASNQGKAKLDEIVKILKKKCSAVNLKRLDENKEMFEASFLVEFKDYKQFKECKSEFQTLDDSLQITFMDNKGII